MNFTEIWAQISPMLQDLLIGLLSLACAYAIKWVKTKTDSLKADTSNALVKEAISDAEKIIEDCVKTTNQTYVDAIKGTTAWTADAQKQAFELTKDAVMKILTIDTIKVIKDSVGDFEAWINTQIESTVSTDKVKVA